MRLRRQLLLIGLLTLALPWGGCQVVREMEETLRHSQETNLRTAAIAVANSLADNPQRLYRTSSHMEASRWPVYDLYAIALPTPLSIDGFASDWGMPPQTAPWQRGGSESADPLRYLLGRRGDYLYLFLSMRSQTLGGAAHLDRADIVLDTPRGGLLRLRFQSPAPGPVLPKINRLTGGDPDPAVSPQRIVAYWQETADGFNLELRIPRDIVGARIGFIVTSADGDSAAGSVPNADAVVPGLWFDELPALSGYLRRFALPDVRLRVADRHGWIAGDSGPSGADDREPVTARSSLALRVYRFLLPEPAIAPIARAAPGRVAGSAATAALSGREWISRERTGDGRTVLTASAPIRDGERVVGSVLAEQPSDAYLSLTDPAAARLLNLTLLLTFGVAAALIAFASMLSWRIGRLRRAAQSALDNRGRLHTTMPGAGSGDELGELARGFEQLLRQVEEYTRYLHGLGDKLAHELRTPLTVVRSSLDNLDPSAVAPDDRAYLERARDGAERLNDLLSALREANRLEQSLNRGEFEVFDLGEMVGNMAAGFRDGFPDRRIEAVTIAAPILAAPDLIAQMIDKLVENAVEFTPPGGRIRLQLAADRTGGAPAWTLRVENDGPRLAPTQGRHLFDSLVTHRSERGATPHLGLGLYIVRLVAEFHGGSVAAGNSETLGGAEFRVTLPAAARSRTPAPSMPAR